MIYGCKMFTLKTGVEEKIVSEKKNFVEIFCLQNHFLERKNFLRKSFGLKFYGCKIISLKTCLQEQIFEKNLLKQFFWMKIFYGSKIISSKTSLQENIF